MAATAQQVIDALKDHVDVTSYSGRGMYGVKCVGVDADRDGDILVVAAWLIRAGLTPDDVENLGDRMRTDQMGKGIIVYWPDLTLTDEQAASLTTDEEDDHETAS